MPRDSKLQGKEQTHLPPEPRIGLGRVSPSAEPAGSSHARAPFHKMLTTCQRGECSDEETKAFTYGRQGLLGSYFMFIYCFLFF